MSEDLSRYETPIEVRRMRPADFDAVIDLQRTCFPGMPTWSRKDLQSHLRHFPEGQMVVELEGRVVGSSSSLVIDFADYHERHSFRDITANGTIANHDPDGRHLYGIEVMVHPDARGMKIGRRLYEARKELCQVMNLESILIAGRMPGYAEVADGLSPKSYLAEVLAGERHDDVLTFQLANGFRVKRLLPGYLPSDKASGGNAVLMEWNNLDHRPPGRRHMMTSHPVRIAVVQYKMREIKGFEEFANQTEYFVDVAADRKADFVLFPELLTTQLLSCIPDKTPAESVRALTTYTDAYAEHFTDLAVRYNTNIIAGTHIIEDDEELRNVCFVFRRDGTIATQEKLHITPNERRWWGIRPGDKLEIIETDVAPIAVQVCYDIEFPETARLATERGARIIFVPYCTEDRQGHLRVRNCAMARAIENQAYVVTAGTVGNLPQSANMDVQYAQSAVFTPSDYAFPRDGIAAEADANVETVVFAELDLEVLRRHRRSGSVAQLQDRRLDLYRVEARGALALERTPEGSSEGVAEPEKAVPPRGSA